MDTTTAPRTATLTPTTDPAAAPTAPTVAQADPASALSRRGFVQDRTAAIDVLPPLATLAAGRSAKVPLVCPVPASSA